MPVTPNSNNNSLKFHKFIWYVWMPFSFLAAALNAYSALHNFSINFSPFQHGGLLLALFLLYCLVEVLFVAAPVAVFIGFCGWKKYAWYILMLLSLSNVFFSFILIPLNFQSYDAASLLGKLCGVVLDLFILYYYWKRKHLFGILSPTRSESTNNTIASNVVCHHCGHSLPMSSKFCAFCGASINPTPHFCRECGLELPAQCKFCPKCGTQAMG